MIATKHEQKLFLFFMTLMMSLSLSVFFFLLEVRPDSGGLSGTIAAWFPRFLKVYVAVVPAVIIISPLAKMLTKVLVAKP